jgi:hypothetical protein
VYFGFTKLGEYFLKQGEGWLFASDNILGEQDPANIRWELRPNGDRGIRRSVFGSVQEEHNMVPLGSQRLYCVYRTTMGYPCHCYSDDDGRSWTEPKPMTYTPGGRIVKQPRACPKLWRCTNGKFLFWYHLHSGRSYQGRNPAWICGGVLKDGRVHWSQPEILLYDKSPQVRMSYPDLVEQHGRYWVTETQKSVARIHEVDGVLLEGTWAQLEDRLPDVPVSQGCIVDADGARLQSNGLVVDKPTTVDSGSGFTVDLWLTVDRFTSGQVLLDARTAAGHGWALTVGENKTLVLTVADARHHSSWSSDVGRLVAGQRHHVAFVVDAGPGIVSVVIDGALCDGGEERQFGWGRFDSNIGNAPGSGTIKCDAAGIRIHRLRIYNRYLRTAEVIQNYRAKSDPTSPADS